MVRDDELEKMVEAARSVTATPEEEELQRRSFVFGNVSLGNEGVTREVVEAAAEDLRRGGVVEV